MISIHAAADCACMCMQAMDKSEPRFGQWMRWHGKMAVIKVSGGWGRCAMTVFCCQSLNEALGTALHNNRLQLLPATSHTPPPSPPTSRMMKLSAWSAGEVVIMHITHSPTHSSTPRPTCPPTYLYPFTALLPWPPPFLLPHVHAAPVPVAGPAVWMSWNPCECWWGNVE